MYDYGNIGVMYASLLLTVLASVRYWLFRDRLRVPFRFMLVILAGISFASGGLWLHMGGIPGMSYDQFRILIVIFLFSLSCFMIKAPIAEHLFSYAFIIAGESAVETTSFFVHSNLLQNRVSYGYPLVSAAIILLTIVPATRSLKRMINRLSKLGADHIWRWLDLAVFAFLIMSVITTMPRPETLSVLYPLGRYLILLGMVGIYKASERIMDTMRLSAETRADLKLTKQRITMQQGYYDKLITQMDEVRKMRHDLRHHRAVLSNLIKNGNMEALSEYFDATAMPEDTQPVTGNLTADSILCFFLDTMKTMEIKTDLKLSIGKETPVSDPDLCILLGNLLENAIDAQKYLPPEQRLIRVTAKADEQTLKLAVDNRFDGTLLLEGKEIISRKEGGGHGIGISSVRSVCEKNGGLLQLKTEGDMFLAGIVINR